MRTNAAHLPIKAWARLAVAVVGLPLFGQQSDLLVSSWRNGALLEYNGTTGAFVNALIPFGGVLEPGGVTFGPDGNIYLSDFSLVLRLNGSTGALMGAFVPSGYGGLKDATYLVFGPDGNLYVIDFDASNVKRYNGQSGSFMGVFTSGETVAVHNPQGLAFGPDGNLYVADEVNVLQYSGTTGSFIRVFVSGGSGGLSGPTGVVFGPDGNLYVGSFNNGAVLRYSGVTGAFRNSFVPPGIGGLQNPNGILFGPDGNLYVADSGTSQVLRYNGTTGAFINAIVTSGSGGLSVATGLTFTPGTTCGSSPSISAISPSTGGNAGSTSPTIQGCGFETGATVKLAGSGADIIGTNSNVLNSSILTTTFQLVGATPGVRNVVLTNPDNTTFTLTGAFTVEQGGAPQISVNIIGRNQIRIGTAQTFYIEVRNQGNVDSSSGSVWVGLPSSATTAFQSSQLPAAGFSSGGTGFVVYGVPPVPAGGSVVLPLLIKAPSSSVQPLKIQTWFSFH